MFVDFNKIFKNKSDINYPIPEVILDYLNAPLKNGLKYIDNGEGMCELTSESGMTISGIELIIDEKIKAYCGNNISYETVWDYAYNTQSNLHLKCQKEGYILINGQEMSVEKMCFNPFENVKFLDGEFIAMPQPFPEPIEITLGDGTYEINEKIQRVPCDEQFCMKMQTVNEAPIFVETKINNKTHHMTCNLKMNLRNVKKVQEIVSIMSVFYALCSGKGLMNGVSILLTENGVSEFKFDKILLEFWEKVLKVEKELKCSFIVPEGEIGNDIVMMIEKLYQMLINRKPIKRTEKYNSLSFTVNMNEGHSIEELKNGKGTFVFDSTSVFNLFGEKITLPSITVLTDVVVSEILSREDQQELIIDNSETVAFCSELVFLDEEKRNEYRVKDTLKDFFEAKPVESYLMNV